MFAQARKGVGDSLAGDRDCSRRHTRRVLQYETLGEVSRREAAETLAQQLAGGSGKGPSDRSAYSSALVSNGRQRCFRCTGFDAEESSAHRDEAPGAAIRRHRSRTSRGRKMQAYIAHLTQAGYAPKTIDHIHDVLSAVLRTAVKWGHLQDNPARDVDLPALRTVRPKWALTTNQAAALLDALPPLGADDGRARDAVRTSAGRVIRAALEETWIARAGCLTVREAVYEGSVRHAEDGGWRSTDSAVGAALAADHGLGAARKTPNQTDFVFSTGSGKPSRPNNVLRRSVFPACDASGAAANHMAHVPADVLVVGARQGRARQGDRRR